jgi:hypothetical protein
LQRISKCCSHSNERHLRELGIFEDGDLYTVRVKPTSGRDRIREECRIQTTEYRRAQRRLDTAHTCSPHLRVEMLKTLCVPVPVAFRSDINSCRSARRLSSKSIHQPRERIKYVSRYQDT